MELQTLIVPCGDQGDHGPHEWLDGVRRCQCLGAPRVIVCGSRRWSDRWLIATVLNELVTERGWKYPLIVHGKCPRGADRLADEEAGKAGLLTEPHPADWDRFGKRAGFIRNEEMAALGARLCIAFWDGKSNGTWDMVERAKAHGIKWEIHFGKGERSLKPLPMPASATSDCAAVASEELPVDSRSAVVRSAGRQP